MVELADRPDRGRRGPGTGFIIWTAVLLLLSVSALATYFLISLWILARDLVRLFFAFGLESMC